MKKWVIVGHGSVGSFVAQRLSAQGASVAVLDPAPRVPVDPAHQRLARGEIRDADYAVSCVGHHAAAAVPELLAGALREDGILFDWNSVSPSTKLQIRDAVPAAMIDVALLDSLDAPVERPHLAVSGGDVDAAAHVLGDHGFNAVVVGDEVGQAARLKYLRSIFMKGLEGLVLEYAALASAVDPGGVIRASLESNLGPRAMEFMDLLLVTDRIHADRRGRELADAVDTLAADGIDLVIAPAVVETLRRAASAWEDPAAPPALSGVDELARHLRDTLWR